MNDSIYLLSIELWKALRRHVVNKKVVADLRVGIDSFTVSLGNSLGKDSGILRVKQKIDSCKLSVLFKAVPVSCKHFSFRVIGVHKHWTPFSTAVLIFKETLAGNRGEVTISIEPEGNPFFRKAAIIFSIVEGFKW